MIAGVCGGIAVRFDAPVGRVRLVHVALWALMPNA
jgi:phage shock protein PspC (stress-responsive transcriptional regulator)